ncbi:MAG: hypothetical protein CMH27_07865 [Micavibrio sp.]|nr:hypothetical protein [Micavibrio sp.]|tara:strand:- start:778 stop:1632 length:855 start_codon:yes stop_codon:yes gene_type:complete
MKKIILFAAIFLISHQATGALAAQSAWGSTAEMQARILSAHETIGPDQSAVQAVLQTRLAPDWHSYWRSPGEAGLPPKILWEEKSDNIASLSLSFPPPKRFKELDLTTFGYDGDVAYPLDIQLNNPGQPVHMDFILETMVCRDICLPVSIPLTLDIDAGNGADSKHLPVIKYAHEKIPSSAETPRLKIENVTITQDRVVANVFNKRGFDRTDVFIEIGEFALPAAPDFQINENDKTHAIVVMPIPQDIQDEFKNNGPDIAYQGHTIRVTVTDGRFAVEQVIDMD